MPELPEVEATRVLVLKTFKGCKIVEVVTRELGGGPRNGQFDELVLANNEQDYDKMLNNKMLIDVQRKGKYIWLVFEGGQCLLLHFGMSGGIYIEGTSSKQYRSSRAAIAESWPPKFAKLLIKFSNDISLVYCDARRLGRVKLQSNPLVEEPVCRLSCDPTVDKVPSVDEFSTSLSNIAVPIKALLLDQDRVFCGIGNYLVDEILFQSRIHPAVPACNINHEGLSAILKNLVHILTTAIECNVQNQEFPDHWLFHQRWDKAKSKNAKVVMPDGKQVTFEEVGGRTTAVVPSVQLRHGGYYLKKGTLHDGTGSEKLKIKAVEPKVKETKKRKGTEVTKDGSGGEDESTTVNTSKEGMKRKRTSMKAEEKLYDSVETKKKDVPQEQAKKSRKGKAKQINSLK